MKTKLIILFFFCYLTGFSQGFYIKYEYPNGLYKSTIQSDTSCYKINSGLLIDAGTYQLDYRIHDTYTYPFHGWYWADTNKEAMILLNLKWKNENDTIDLSLPIN
jgi:hypothetical protein